MIYLDNAATTPIHEEVLDAMKPYLTNQYGNPGAIYKLGRDAKKAIDDARESVASAIGCQPEQVIFTSGGSEANNLAIKGASGALRRRDRTHIVSSSMEHDSVLNALKSLQSGQFSVSYAPSRPDGTVDIKTLFEDRVRENTGMVSVMYSNNETGATNKVEKIASFCKQRGILFHTDAVQAFGSHDIDVGKIECGLMSVSGHKIHAPKGIGALYVKDKILLSPLISGGSYQEFGLRGGTENVAAIVGFGKACEILKGNFSANKRKIYLLQHAFTSVLSLKLNEYGLLDILHWNSPADSYKICNFRFDGVDAQTLILFLDSRDIFVSGGSACRANESEPSGTLLAMGLSKEQAHESIRVSFSCLNTVRDMYVAARQIAEGVAFLRQDIKKIKNGLR